MANSEMAGDSQFFTIKIIVPDWRSADGRETPPARGKGIVTC
jgi:hypothetical protein